MIIAILVVIGLLGALADEAEYDWTKFVRTDLIAGQNINIGTVTVYADIEAVFFSRLSMMCVDPAG